MPFPPYHLGPGLAFKALGGQRFSFVIFGGAQFLIDLEPGIRMIIGTPLLHGVTHTLAGAIVIGTLAAVIGKPISERVLKFIGTSFSPLTWTASAAGAYLATFSHLLLDGLIHADMRPWFPLTDASGILGLIPLGAVHTVCIVSGVAGVLVLLVQQLRRRPARVFSQPRPAE